MSRNNRFHIPDKLDEFKALISHAVTDYEVASSLANQYRVLGYKRYKSGCSYHIQQCLEKILKFHMVVQAFINKDCAIIFGLNSDKYGHNLVKLLELVKIMNIGKHIYISRYLISLAQILSSWEADSRYNVPTRLDIRQLEKCIKEVGISLTASLKYYESILGPYEKYVNEGA